MGLLIFIYSLFYKLFLLQMEQVFLYFLTKREEGDESSWSSEYLSNLFCGVRETRLYLDKFLIMAMQIPNFLQ